MKLYLLVTADKFELPIACDKSLTNFTPLLKTKVVLKRRINAWLNKSIANNSKITLKFCRAYIRQVEINLTLSDIYYTLKHDNTYLFDTFTSTEIAKCLNISIRTYFRHAQDYEWLLKKLKKSFHALIQKLDKGEINLCQ